MYKLRSRDIPPQELNSRRTRKRKLSGACEENLASPGRAKKMKVSRREPLKDKDDNIDAAAVHHEKGSILQKLKASLHTSVPNILTGRDKETAKIGDFIKNRVTNHTPGSLYISGPPGTGKTAAVTKYLTSPEVLTLNVDVIIVNCMRFDSPNAVYKDICDKMVKPSATPRKMDLQKMIIKKITASTKRIVLVLDEIDQLNSRSQQVLYSIFEWPFLQNSSLILIAIANSLDLTDRMLPRLQANPKICPELLHFCPYTKDDIATIIENRLSNIPNVIDKMAVQFCARKVASVNGDVRKALDICRRAVELVEKKESDDGSSAATVTVGHVATVVGEVYGTIASGTKTAAEDVPLQQKLVACTLLLMARKGVNEPSLGKLYETYGHVCLQRHLRHESQSEILSLVNMLEVRGVVQVKHSKRSSLLSKVRLLLQEVELTHALQDKTLITSILQTTQL